MKLFRITDPRARVNLQRSCIYRYHARGGRRGSVFGADDAYNIFNIIITDGRSIKNVLGCCCFTIFSHPFLSPSLESTLSFFFSFTVSSSPLSALSLYPFISLYSLSVHFSPSLSTTPFWLLARDPAITHTPRP